MFAENYSQYSLCYWRQTSKKVPSYLPEASRSLLGANKPDLKIPLLRHDILKELRNNAFGLEKGQRFKICAKRRITPT